MESNGKDLHPTITRELSQLFYVYSPGETSFHLRKLLVSFVLNEKDTPYYYDNLINNMDFLLDFLEIADYVGVETDANKAHLRRMETEGKKEVPVLAEASGNIEDITNLLVRLIAPEKVFRVQSPDPMKDDNEPYYDFLVVVPDRSQTPFKKYETLIDLLHVKNANVSFSLHKSATIYEQLKEGHLLYSSICKAEHLVFDDNSSQLPKPDDERLVQKKKLAQHELTISLEKATSFFEGAKMYIDRGSRAMAAFMIQQCVELTLRGFIKSFVGGDIRSHSIKLLLKHVHRISPKFTAIFAPHPVESRLLELLETAYLSARYGNFDVNQEELKSLLNKAQALMKLSQAERELLN